MTDLLSKEDLDKAVHDLVDLEIYPILANHDQEVQLINQAATDIRERLRKGEDMDDEASNYVVWLGGLNRDVMLYGLQRLLKPTVDNIVFSDKAQARVDALQGRLDATTGYVAASFKTIDHQPWPRVYLDGTTLDERVTEILEEDLRENKVDLPTVDMVLNGIKYDQELDPSYEYALATSLCYSLKDYYEAAKDKSQDSLENRIFHEKMDNFLGWCMRASPEMVMLAGQTVLMVCRVKFEPAELKNWDAYANAYQNLIIKP